MNQHIIDKRIQAGAHIDTRTPLQKAISRINAIGLARPSLAGEAGATEIECWAERAVEEIQDILDASNSHGSSAMKIAQWKHDDNTEFWPLFEAAMAALAAMLRERGKE